MFDTAAFSLLNQRSTTSLTGGGESARVSAATEGPGGAGASASGFGPSVILPDAVKAITKSEVTTTTGEQRRSGSPTKIDDASATEPDADRADDAAEQEGTNGPFELSDEEEAVVEQLQERDAEVRAHENAHASAGGQYAGAPTYTYQTGPDGKQYAIGGAVSIDTSPIADDPQATITKMATVIRAALAPAEPSAQDRNVAQAAQRQMAAAQADLAKQQSAISNDRQNEGEEGEPALSALAETGPATFGGESAPVAEIDAIQQAISAYQRAGGI